MLSFLATARHGVIAIITASVLTSCGGSDAPAPKPAAAVSVVKVETSPIGRYREFVARTEAKREVELRARVEGTLLSRNFVEGESVTKDQLLFKIDPESYIAELNKAQAELTSAEAAQRRADRDLERGKELAPQGHISQSDLDKLTSNAEQGNAEVAAAKAALKQAELNLHYTNITAPFAGQIGKAYFSEGNLVNPSSGALASLVDIDPIYVNFQIEEDAYLSYQQDRNANPSEHDSKTLQLSLRLPNNTLLPSPGIINFTDTEVDQTMGTVNIRAQFANPDGLVLPGLYVTLIMETANKQQLPLVPQAAVQENQQGKFVLVVDKNNMVTPQPVEMGRRIDAMWAVNSGLKGGETIIIEGLQKVRPGIQVMPSLRIIDPKTGALTSPAASNNSQPVQKASH